LAWRKCCPNAKSLPINVENLKASSISSKNYHRQMNKHREMLNIPLLTELTDA
jgi:hypothetical protein